MATKLLSHNAHREAGKSHLEYMRELLSKQGDDAKIDLHADHMRSLLAFASSDEH
ncbi:hypothetical protein G6321_00019110 [Bradyrhizobium barranii subsp. barranii]|uniref:Uncharacterized protein n=1 Tax=Bradyrhizobium barranii subsp. barranii TaxID=2823807 RepID=A0A7Z0TTM1_9BRAD|nr:hypothetical protein [Bradyrhizobium barranii]UGX97122.1 hypothetical protein G6321_00019110 [Bradyrhizobium barranii subsp. barranii]